MTTIDEIKARLAAATPGPWTYQEDRWGFSAGVYGAPNERGYSEMIVGGDPCEGRIEPDDPNGTLIAHAPADIAYLLAEVARLRADLIEERDALACAMEQVAELNDALVERGAEVERLRAALPTENEIDDLREGVYGDDRMSRWELEAALAVVRKLYALREEVDAATNTGTGRAKGGEHG